jgi:hypothetical protein
MNPKGFLILVVAAALSVAAAAIAIGTAPQYAATAEVGEKVFPNLMEKVDNVARIKIVHPEKTVNIMRQGAGWVLAEADDYPAETKRLGKALLGLAQLELFEPKTRLKERYKELWVGDPQKKGGQAKLVTLFDKDDKVINKIIVGRTKFDVEGSEGGGGSICAAPTRSKVGSRRASSTSPTSNAIGMIAPSLISTTSASRKSSSAIRAARSFQFPNPIQKPSILSSTICRQARS